MCLKPIKKILFITFILCTPFALGAPGDILFEDDFEGNLAGWNVGVGSGDASIGNETSNSGNSSLRLRWNSISISTNVIPADVAGLELKVWIREGSDSFSENPEAGDNLVLEYRAANNSWVSLETFFGGGTQGDIYERDYILPANALHANFQLRFRQLTGSGFDFDYWHIDDVKLIERTANAIPGLIGEWQFEELVWNGNNDEVLDSSGNGLHLTAFSAATSNVLPAITGDPGTCYYGVFNGSISFIQRDDDLSTSDSLLDIPDNLTITTWINTNVIPATGLKSILSKDENYEFHIDENGQIYWWWRWATLTTTGASLQVGQWHHIAVTWRSGEQVIYIDGIERAREDFVGTLDINNDPLQIGQDLDIPARFFDGYIDEVRIYENFLSAAQVNQVMLETHPCIANTICSLIYVDRFDTNSYSNSNGRDPWSGNWIESDDDGSATSGKVRVTGGRLRMTNNTGANNNPSLEREFDINGANSAILKVELSTSNTLENADIFEISASDDGGASWTVLPSGTFTDDINNTYTYDLLGFASTNTRIRFRIAQGYRASDEFIYIDNVGITATKDCGPDHFRVVHDGNGINCLREAITIRAEDSSGNLVTDYTGTINLTTSTTNGNWFVVDESNNSSDPAQGTLTDTANDNDGAATYQFTAADNGSVVLYLQDTQAESVNIDVAEGGITDDDTEGTITFRPYGFVFSPSPIPTQVAGKPFDVTLSAAGQTPNQAQCGVIEEYTGIKTLNLWSDYSQPNTSPTQVSVNGNLIATNEAGSAPQNVTFNNGVTTLSVQYDDAGEISLSATDQFDVGDPPPGNIDEIIGGIPDFVVRPFGYDIQIASNPYALDQNSSVFTTAATQFPMTLRSVIWESADDQIINATGVAGSDGIPDPFIDTNSDGIPDSGGNLSNNAKTPNVTQINQTILLTPSALVVNRSNGNLSTTSLSLNTFDNTGELTFNQSWDEVGILQIDALTSDFMGGGEDVIGQRINIGRFIPASFLLTPTNIATQCGSFTYAGFFDGINAGLDKNGQFFNIAGTLRARNASGNTTQNYHGVFAKLSNSEITALPYDVTASAAANGRVNFTPNLAAFSDGLSSFSAANSHFQYASLTSPFDLRIDMEATDSDSVTSGTVNSNVFEVRLGRLRLIDAYGPETSDLEIQLRSEYYNGSDWITNIADSCTTYIATDIGLLPGSYTENLNSGETTVYSPTVTPENLTNGVSALGDGLLFSAPGAGNYGSVELQFNLGSQLWLQFDWDADNSLDTSNAILNFGYYRGSDRVIYWRENRN